MNNKDTLRIAIIAAFNYSLIDTERTEDYKSVKDVVCTVRIVALIKYREVAFTVKEIK